MTHAQNCQLKLIQLQYDEIAQSSNEIGWPLTNSTENDKNRFGKHVCAFQHSEIEIGVNKDKHELNLFFNEQENLQRKSSSERLPNFNAALHF